MPAASSRRTWLSALCRVVSSVSAIRVIVSTGSGHKIDRLDREADLLADELSVLVNARLWLAFGTTALVTAHILVIFSYLAPLLTQTTGFPEKAMFTDEAGVASAGMGPNSQIGPSGGRSGYSRSSAVSLRTKVST